MNLQAAKIAAKKGGQFIGKHSPLILTILGTGGVITTTIFAVKATPKAMLLLEEKKKEAGQEELGKMDTVKTCWKVYIPTGLMALATIGCFLGAQGINMKRNAALASLYSITEHTLKEYQAKVIEQIGENQEKKVRDAVAQTKMDKQPASSSEIIITGSGYYLCYDAFSGRYFQSDIEKLRRIENDVNRELIQSMYISLNEVYDMIGLKRINIGDEIGWSVDEPIEFTFGTHLTDDGKPCLVMDYSAYPRHNFDKMY